MIICCYLNDVQLTCLTWWGASNNKLCYFSQSFLRAFCGGCAAIPAVNILFCFRLRLISLSMVFCNFTAFMTALILIGCESLLLLVTLIWFTVWSGCSYVSSTMLLLLMFSFSLAPCISSIELKLSMLISVYDWLSCGSLGQFKLNKNLSYNDWLLNKNIIQDKAIFHIFLSYVTIKSWYMLNIRIWQVQLHYLKSFNYNVPDSCILSNHSNVLLNVGNIIHYLFSLVTFLFWKIHKII